MGEEQDWPTSALQESLPFTFCVLYVPVNTKSRSRCLSNDTLERTTVSCWIPEDALKMESLETLNGDWSS
ncbi:hypothetical protein TESG_07657 [Trichophyton tonsurans CBS 112818]|uniref:Uncharacterized protein n=1 Tax=Trichophyton tonsurans (strain CBS 112818) TaxID=647933 RepID=F2S9U3_TRIT1|nr:hypothetical protein TESG_07657 [Trichophyton tonsurans CBS 112818]